MKKIFRMAKAELSKIFTRPSMFLLTGILVIALVLSFFFFSPKTVTTKTTYDYSDTFNIYNAFMEDYSKNSDDDIINENDIINAKKDIELYLKTDTYTDFCNKVYELKYYMFGTNENEIGEFRSIMQNTISNNQPNSKLQGVYLTDCVRAFNGLKTQVGNVTGFMLENIKDKDINFYLPTKTYNDTYETLTDMYKYIPNELDLKNYTIKMLIERYEYLLVNYNLTKMYNNIASCEKIEIDEAKLKKLLDDYFYSNLKENTSSSTGYSPINNLKNYYDDIETYYLETLSTPNDKKVISNLNEKIAKYFDYAKVCKELIENKFELLRIGEKSDDEISKYVSFSKTSAYNLRSNVTKNSYIHKTGNFGYQYLNSFNFNTNSGTETNAFDFVVYAMQILSCFIIIFTIFFAVGTLSGEQSSGTLKMIATRPYTRNKVYSGKFLACFSVALILLLVSFATSLTVGAVAFGFTFKNVLLIFNSSKVMIMNPLVLILLYLLNIFIDVVFYIALAIMVSMFIKQTAISTALTSGLYIASTILIGTVKSSWLRFIPTTNLQLFKFLTTSKIGIFSFSIVPNTDLVFALVIVVLCTLAFDLISRFLFSRRSIDK